MIPAGYAHTTHCVSALRVGVSSPSLFPIGYRSALRRAVGVPALVLGPVPRVACLCVLFDRKLETPSLFQGNQNESHLVTATRTTTQAVSRWSVALEARVQSRASLCRICRGQSGTGTGFSPSTSVLPSHYDSIKVPFSFIYHQE